MFYSVCSHGLSGLAGFPVTVETDLSGGLPAMEIVGLPDAAVRESRERVRSAIRNAGYEFPVARITVNLTPADRKKEGSMYDLPIALSILAASGQLGKAKLADTVALGELALDGSVRPVNGVLPMVIDAHRNGINRFLVPMANASEAACIEGIKVYPSESLAELAKTLRDGLTPPEFPNPSWKPEKLTYSTDFCEIKGQQGAKRAAEIAVAGGHNLLLIGTPGSGKTMLARAIPSILPELTFEEALEITQIHSVAGGLGGKGIVRERPFRAPHHGASAAALVGGGAKALPGEISLAHRGVLFLDELPEFRRDVLEALRQPLEDGFITVSRAMGSATYPADFVLVAAMNPCPCGNYGSRTNPCRCTAAAIHRYRNRISAPLMDRIDMHVEMPELGYGELSSRATGECSADIRSRVNRARELQRQRYMQEDILCNAQMTPSMLRRYCPLCAASEEILQKAFERLRLSARAYGRILKVARTIADVEGETRILPAHCAEAVQYRGLDMNG